MFNFKKANINNKTYILKINGDSAEAIAVLYKGRYKTTISLPTINYSEIKESCIELTKTDVEQLGYLTSKNSSLQLIDSDIRLDVSFLLENQSYVENIDIVKSLLEASNDKNKGMIVFDNNGELQKHLKSKNIEFDLYNPVNLKIKYSDLNERILLDVLNLTEREQSAVASIINFKEVNKGNEDIGLKVLTGSNWLYDLFIVEPSTLAQQFKVSEFNIKMLKTSLLQLNSNGFMSQEFSNINEIIKKVEDGKLVVIDVKDRDKKLIKATIAHNAMSELIVVDNVYHKFDNIQYLLYSTNLFQGTTRNFKSYVINKNSYTLKEELVQMQYYLNELKYLDFEYIIIKENSFPIIATNEEYIKNKVLEKIKVTSASTVSFF